MIWTYVYKAGFVLKRQVLNTSQHINISYEEILDFPPCIDFSCTSLTYVCILVKICQYVAETVTRDRILIASLSLTVHIHKEVF